MPVLTPLDGGGFMAAWRDRTNDGDWYGTFAQVFDTDGNTVGGEFQVNTTTHGNQFNPSISKLSNGNVIITWWDGAADGNEYGMFGQIFSETGSKIGSQFQINTYTTDQQHSGKVTGLDDGGFAVTWTSVGQDGDSGGIYVQLFDESGNKTGSEIQVNSTTTGSQDAPDIALLSDGNFVITWQSDGQDGSGKGVYAQIFNDSGVTVGAEFLVNSITAADEYKPSITSLRGGGFIISWEGTGDHGGYGHDIFAQRFYSDGTRNGSEFQVNPYDISSASTSTNNGQQTNSEATQLSDGRVLFTWDSTIHDGDGKGVFAQIFDVGASVSSPDLASIDNALQTLNVQRSALGSISNRLDHIVANNTNISVNIAASIGRIKDADFANETTNLAKTQILQQASTAMLAQANAAKQNVLSLLQG